MGNSNYQRASKKERELCKLFEGGDMNKDAGAITTVRAAGSKGIFDVVILTPTGARFIQVKTCQKDGNYNHEYEQAKEKIKELPKVADNITMEVWVYQNNKGWIKREVIK